MKSQYAVSTNCGKTSLLQDCPKHREDQFNAKVQLTRITRFRAVHGLSLANRKLLVTTLTTISSNLLSQTFLASLETMNGRETHPDAESNCNVSFKKIIVDSVISTVPFFYQLKGDFNIYGVFDKTCVISYGSYLETDTIARCAPANLPARVFHEHSEWAAAILPAKRAVPRLSRNSRVSSSGFATTSCYKL